MILILGKAQIVVIVLGSFDGLCSDLYVTSDVQALENSLHVCNNILLILFY